MVTQQIIDFIARARNLYHLNDAAIRSQLLATGWQEADINEAMNVLAPTAVPTQTAPTTAASSTPQSTASRPVTISSNPLSSTPISAAIRIQATPVNHIAAVVMPTSPSAVKPVPPPAAPTPAPAQNPPSTPIPSSPENKAAEIIRGITEQQSHHIATRITATPSTQNPIFSTPAATPPPPQPPLNNQNVVMPSATAATSTSTLQQAVAPSVNKMTGASMPKKSHLGAILWTITILIFISIIGAGVVFAYQNGIGPFNKPPYTSSNVISNGLTKVASINTARYTYSISLLGSPRDSNAAPFVYDKKKVNAEIEQLRPLYERDKNRITLLNTLISSIRNYTSSSKTKKYPETLAKVIENASKNSYNKKTLDRYEDILKDFSYTAKPNQEGYHLSIQFETLDAPKALKSGNQFYISSSSKESFVLDGLKLTLDETTSYISAYSFTGTPPKPPIVAYLESRDQMLSFLPSDLDFQLQASGVLRKKDPSSDKNSGETEMSINSDVKLGDSNYSFGLDFKLLNKINYIRVTKFPSIPFLTGYFDIAKVKGQWVKITEEDQKNTLGNFLFSTSSLSAADDASQKSAEAYKKIVQILEEEKAISTKGEPLTDSVDGALAYKYEFSINKDSILPIFKRYSKEVLPLLLGTSTQSESAKEAEKETLEIIQSDMFKQLFDHVAQNSSFYVWFNKEGYPIKASYRTRIIPLDDTVKLKDQQFIFETNYNLRDINTEISITEPATTIDWDKAVELTTGQGISTAQSKAKKALIQSTLSSLRVNAELYYSKNKKSYGAEYAKSSCINALSDEKSFFTVASTTEIFASIKEKSDSAAESRCAGNSKSYAISFEIPPEEDDSTRAFYCIDNIGTSKVVYASNPDDTIIKTKSGNYECK